MSATDHNPPPLKQKAARKAHFKFNLFWKVFAWFWLTMIVVITLYLFIGYVNSGKIHYRPLPAPIEKELSHITQRTSNQLSNNKRFRRMPHGRANNVYILDEQGTDLFTREVPELLGDLHSRVKRHHHSMLAHQNKEAYFGGNTLQFDNKTYRVYAKHREPLFNRLMLKNFFSELTRTLLISTFIISFPISFLLSWVITRPIKQLQVAVKAMQSDLSDNQDLLKLNSRGDEFGELARDFDQMAGHINSLLTAQKQLVSDVSHELRSPLTRMQIALSLAQDEANDAAQTNLQHIKRESHRMNQMLENLLALSKMNALDLHGTRENFDLVTVLHSVINDCQFEANQANISFHSKLPVSYQFTGFKEALMSGIENIIRNAITYSGENSQVSFVLFEQQNSLILSVADTGKGVPQEQLTKLFDPFYRTDSDRARNSGGVGLGLSIAKRAFELNSGSIKAENVTPHGLKIIVTFNLPAKNS